MKFYTFFIEKAYSIRWLIFCIYQYFGTVIVRFVGTAEQFQRKKGRINNQWLSVVASYPDLFTCTAEQHQGRKERTNNQWLSGVSIVILNWFTCFAEQLQRSKGRTKNH
jgi:hypothetical protein